MLYLGDYLEVIEHLPQELRDRFTEMREMDLSVQNNTDALDKRARVLFQQCRRGELPTAAADAEFDAIRNDYYRVLEDSDEKIQLAGQMYDLVERYQRRLDTELYKFKCELEADHNGITEILEKRSLELDSTTTANGSTNQKENRFYDAQHSYASTPSGRSDSRHKMKAVKRRESMAVTAMEKRSAAAAVAAAAASATAVSSVGSSSVAPLVNTHIRPTTPGIVGTGTGAATTVVAHPVVASPAAGVATYNLQTCAAGNAIAAAASQAIAQTQQMQQGRRTASLKASYEAIGVVGSHELLLTGELAGATHNALQAVERESSGVFTNQRRQKKKNIANSSSTNTTSAGGVRGTTTTTILSNNANVTTVLASTNQLAHAGQTSFTSVTLQVQQPALQQQLGSIPSQQPQQQQTALPPPPPTSQFTTQQQSIAVSQQLPLHHSSSQVPVQHLQQTHQPPILQQISTQQQQLQQSPAIRQQLHSQQIQIGGNQQQKHLLLPQMAQPSQRLQRPQQLQQSLQSPQSITPQLLQQVQQQTPSTSQQPLRQPLPLQQLQLQHLAQPLSQASQLQQLQQQQLLLPQAQQKPLKSFQQQSFQPLSQTQQQHIVQQQVVHLQSQQHQLQQLQPLQQHHLQLSQQQQLQISQQQGQQQQQQPQQQLQIAQQQPSQQQLIELQQKDPQLQQTLQQQVLQQQHQVLQQQQQILQQTQQPQLQVQHHLIHQQQLSQKQSQQQVIHHQQQPSQAQQQFLATNTTSNVLANVQPAVDLLSSTNTPSSAIGTVDSTNTSASSSAVNSNMIVLNESVMMVEQTSEAEWSYDPNEPRYCICNQVSYGDMVACDNEDCPFEWFHYPCVNITSSPKGKWYCPQCSSSMKRRASRKN